VTSGRGYLLRVGREDLDAARFQDGFTAGRAALEAGRHAEAAQTLGRALELWRGPVLADLADYAFTRPEAARLGELRLAAREARIDADLALGRHDALTAELQQLAGEHPLRERLHGQLMLALYRCDRQADALAAYRRVHELLADELGIDPGEPLRRPHASVLAQDPALDWNGGRQALAEHHPSGAQVPAPEAGSPGRRFMDGGELAWVRRRAPQALVAEVAATPLRYAPPAGVGVGTRVHAVPFHRTIMVFAAELLPVEPTAHALLAEVAATPPREPLTVNDAAGPTGRGRAAAVTGAAPATTPATNSGTARTLTKRAAN